VPCDEMALLIHASLDGELDAAHAAQVEQHLAGCAGCSQELARLQSLRTTLRAHATRHRLPEGARNALLARLLREQPVPPDVPQPRFLGSRRRALGAIAAAVVAGIALDRSVVHLLAPDDRSELDSLVAAHIRALQPGHAIDVVSADGHTVKPWFDGRIEYSPPVKDLGEHGFALLGGRLDYAVGRTVAVIVYRRRQHLIDLFAWPASAGDGSPQAVAPDGYHLRRWTQDGFHLAAISDLNETELDEFVRLWRAA
jgi:anti-sigma factor RsiW